MNLGNLNETVIIIDSDYLNKAIKDNLDFYSDLYPEKHFNKINLAELVLSLAANARINENGRPVDVIFAYTLDKDSLFFCNPTSLLGDINETMFQSEIGNFYLKTLFAGEGQTNTDHVLFILNQVYLSKNVARIVLVADNAELNYDLYKYYAEREKSLFLIKSYHDSEITVPVAYVKIDYPVAFSLGLKTSEL